MNEWVYTKDRLPTREDADSRGWVLVPHPDGDNTMFCKFEELEPRHYAWKTPDAPPPKLEEWRVPTWDDLKNGPIEARFRNSPQHPWKFDTLIGISSKSLHRYANDSCGSWWKYCEIKVHHG